MKRRATMREDLGELLHAYGVICRLRASCDIAPTHAARARLDKLSTRHQQARLRFVIRWGK